MGIGQNTEENFEAGLSASQIDFIDFVSQRVPASKSTRSIIDIGCGEGALSSELTSFGDVTGVDISEESIAKAREAYPEIEFLVSDACTLPYEEQFDIAISHDAFHWVPNHVSLLNSVNKVIKNQGLLIVETGAHGHMANVESAFSSVISRHSGDYANRFVFPQDRAYKRLLGIAGFEIEHLEIIDGKLPLPGKEGLRQFAQEHFFKSLAPYNESARETILAELEKECRAEMWIRSDNCWFIDRSTMRIVAKKVKSACMPAAASPLSALRA